MTSTLPKPQIAATFGTRPEAISHFSIIETLSKCSAPRPLAVLQHNLAFSQIGRGRNGLRIVHSRAKAGQVGRDPQQLQYLSVNWFALLSEERRLIGVRRRDYKDSRLHMALGNQTPTEYLDRSGACASKLALVLRCQS